MKSAIKLGLSFAAGAAVAGAFAYACFKDTARELDLYNRMFRDDEDTDDFSDDEIDDEYDDVSDDEIDDMNDKEMCDETAPPTKLRFHVC